MKCYYVDLTSLPPERRVEESERLDKVSFMASDCYDGRVLVGVNVYWDRKADFETSGLVPSGCPCRLVL